MKLITNRLIALPLLFSANAYAAYSDTGSWSNVIEMPIIPVAVSNLPNGNILTWAAKDRQGFGGTSGRTYTAIFNPTTGTSNELLVSNTQHDMFCPGINNLSDGRILVSGGSGNDKTSIYDPVTDVWQTADPMNTIRGYQANVTLGDGSLLTLGGSWNDNSGNKNAERWTQEAGWIPYPAIKSIDTVRDGAPDPAGEFRDDNHAWLWTAPNGKVFHAGPSSNMHWIDFEGNGTVTQAGSRADDPYSMNGTTVMYDIGKILKTGGAQAYDGAPGVAPATKGSYVIDINTDSAIVAQVQDMTYARSFHHSTVLPNGEVFVAGGMKSAVAFSDLDAVLIGEIWNPNTQTWKQVAPMITPRTYHSVAILLNDGRVFVGGGGLCSNCTPDINHPDAEIYSPPYLYVAGTDTLATRPLITQAPATAGYDANITVKTDNAINAFSLIRASSATHSVNNEQRRIPISFTETSTHSYELTMPGRNIAPPGKYMLFALNALGTPSVSKVIKVGSYDVTPSIVSGKYQIESPTSGERLGAPEWNQHQARMVTAGTWEDQQWNIKHLGGLVYTVQNVATGKYLEVKDSFCETTGLEYIFGSDKSTSKSQRWIITHSGGSNVNFRPQHCKTKALDREGGLLSANAIVWNFQVNHGPQLWKLNLLEANPEPPINTVEGIVLQNGEYWLESPTQSQRLAAPSWYNFKSRMVDPGEWDDQKWIITHIGDGIHIIKNKKTFKYLEIANAYCGDSGGTTSGSDGSASKNQQWRVYQSGSNYNLKPVHCPSKSLDRELGLAYADAIISDSEIDHAPQLWKLQFTDTNMEIEPIADGRYWLGDTSFGQRLAAPSWNAYSARMVIAGTWDDQQWDIKHLGDGQYTVQNASTLKYLQVNNNFCGEGIGTIDSSDTAAAENQKWLIIKNDSSYNFRPVHCQNKGLVRAGGLFSADAILLDAVENHDPQLWKINVANEE